MEWFQRELTLLLSIYLLLCDWEQIHEKEEISDETHFKNKFISLWKLPLKYLWMQNLEETIDDEEIDGEKNRKE